MIAPKFDEFSEKYPDAVFLKVGKKVESDEWTRLLGHSLFLKIFFFSLTFSR